MLEYVDLALTISPLMLMPRVERFGLTLVSLMTFGHAWLAYEDIGLASATYSISQVDDMSSVAIPYISTI